MRALKLHTPEHPAPRRGLGLSGVSFPEGGAGTLPQEARRGKRGHLALRARGARARESARATAVRRTVQGSWWWAIVIIRKFKPGGYTGHSRCFPPREDEGSWAPGHLVTSGEKKTKNNKKRTLPTAGVPERGPRDSSRFPSVPPVCAPNPARPERLGAQVEWGGLGRADPARDAHLAGARPAARMVHASSGRLLGALVVPLPRAAARHRGHRAAAPCTPGLATT